MGPAYKSWQESGHSNVTCYGCHGALSIPSLLVHKVKALNELRLHVTDDYKKPINVESHLADDEHEMSSDMCNRCHSVTKREVTATEGIIINHEVHEKKDVHCTKCHNRVGHKTANKHLDKEEKEKEEHYEDHMEMKACMKCHTGEKEKGPKECITCHPKDFELKPKNHKQKKFFPDKHVKMASKDTEYCESCHFKNKKCIDCHKVEMPHPSEGWTKIVKEKEHHSKKGKSDLEGCQQCHKEGVDFCDSCHHANNTGKKWIDVHYERVKKQGAAQPCFKCHEALYCAKCHVTIGKKK